MLPDDPDGQARFFYLALLGLAVAAWVFKDYRHRLGQAAQHAAIWVLIFAGAVLAYGFKDNLGQMLNPDQALRVDENAVALRRASDGHFYATLEINGADIRVMVDTGATRLVLTEDDARTAGIDTGRLNFVIPASTANGQVMSAPVRLDTVALADFVDEDFRAMVNGGELDVSLLGMEYLDRYRSFQVEGDTMLLRR
ncbi:MAG: TIGR02281 family clan AA aspartic protease [Pseudomonadota bacterium]